MVTRGDVCIYFGAGWDCSPLRSKHLKECTNFIFVDSLPQVPHYLPGQAGYVHSTSIERIISALVKDSRRKPTSVIIDAPNSIARLTFGQREITYFLNKSVLDFVRDCPELLAKTTVLYTRGFEPVEFGLNILRDLPALRFDIENRRIYHRSSWCPNQI